MQKRLPSLSGYGITWSANKRVAIVALVITALLIITATTAWFTGRSEHDQSAGCTVPVEQFLTLRDRPGTRDGVRFGSEATADQRTGRLRQGGSGDALVVRHPRHRP